MEGIRTQTGVRGLLVYGYSRFSAAKREYPYTHALREGDCVRWVKMDVWDT